MRHLLTNSNKTMSKIEYAAIHLIRLPENM